MQPVETLKSRRDFLSLRRAPVSRCPYFILARGNAASRALLPDRQSIRVGFTVTKKLGNAVVRNRIRRRLRHAFADGLARFGSHESTGSLDRTPSERDYVVIARPAALRAPYELLVEAVADALTALAKGRHKTSHRQQAGDASVQGKPSSLPG